VVAALAGEAAPVAVDPATGEIIDAAPDTEAVGVGGFEASP
jgi:hypothetical protein